MEEERIKNIAIVLMSIIIIGMFLTPRFMDNYSQSIRDDLIIEIVDSGVIYLAYIECDEINKTLLIEQNQTEYLNQLKKECDGENIVAFSQSLEEFKNSIQDPEQLAVEYIQNNLPQVKQAIC